MNCQSCKYWWNRLAPKMMDSAFLSTCGYFLTAGARVQDAKAICLSEPSCMRWDSMAPSPEGDASPDKMSGSSGSK